MGVTLLHHEGLVEALEVADLETRLIVTPLLEDSQIGQASIDLRLGTEFLLLRRTLRAGLDLEVDQRSKSTSCTRKSRYRSGRASGCTLSSSF